MMDNSIVLIAHDIRSAHNVGALFRTAEGLGIDKLFLTGYTPYPLSENDKRLPHLAKRSHHQIEKTALGAYQYITWEHITKLDEVLDNLRSQGYILAGLEQHSRSVNLNEFRPPKKIVILLGSELSGIEEKYLSQLDLIIEIPMSGKKESFNVVEAASIAMYHCKYAIVS